MNKTLIFLIKNLKNDQNDIFQKIKDHNKNFKTLSK